MISMRIWQLLLVYQLFGSILTSAITTSDSCLIDLLDRNRLHFRLKNQFKSFDYVRLGDSGRPNSNDYISLSNPVEIDNSCKRSLDFFYFAIVGFQF